MVQDKSGKRVSARNHAPSFCFQVFRGSEKQNVLLVETVSWWWWCVCVVGGGGHSHSAMQPPIMVPLEEKKTSMYFPYVFQERKRQLLATTLRKGRR